MPKYQVALDDGRKFMVEATAPPSEDDIYAALGQQQPAAPASAGERFVKGAWDMVNPVAAVTGAAHAIAHPLSTAAGLLNAQLAQFHKARQDYQQGHYSEMIGHGAAGVLPLLGPAAAEAGEQIGSGDIAGGLGKATGLVGTALLGAKAPGAAEDAVNAVERGASRAAERVITSNVKPPPSLVTRNPGVNIARVILDEKLKPGFAGAEQGRAVSARLADEVTSRAATKAATGATHDIQPLYDSLVKLRDKYAMSPAGADNVAAIEAQMHDLMNHPTYSREKFATVNVPQQVQVPTGAIDAAGQPIFQTQTQMVPQQVSVGRELVPQSADVINQMKRQIYEDNPKSYGERKGATIQGEKSQGRELKGILDQNVPGVQELNEQNAGVITARKALNKMGVREENKYPLGLMDIGAAATAAATHMATGNPLLAAITGVPILLKHPTTAFPIARGLDAVGHMKRVAPAAKAATATAVGGKVIDNALRKVTKTEAQSRYEAYLASQQ